MTFAPEGLKPGQEGIVTRGSRLRAYYVRRAPPYDKTLWFMPSGGEVLLVNTIRV